VHRFFGLAVGVGNAWCFRLGRVAKRNGAFAVRGGFLVWCGHAGGNTVNRVSGCMSVAGCGMRIPSSEDGPGAGFAAREMWRARGSGGSPRNG
jgi:hypothetical protein